MVEQGYYDKSLAASRLRECYEMAPPRTVQALEAEIQFVLEHISPSSRVLELGCGYGRVIRPLAFRAAEVWGIDTSLQSLRFGVEGVEKIGLPNVRFAAMDAGALGLASSSFDVVACIQNGLSAFKVDQKRVVREAIRVTRAGGRVLFSSYSETFWEERLEWFQIQAAHGLIGKIIAEETGDGVIVCDDGFRATTVLPSDFLALAEDIGLEPEIVEIDDSSLFCVFAVS